jgi:signal-transduction protein with cAMP-binding, CBS, and nucleotidyltransferase domain
MTQARELDRLVKKEETLRAIGPDDTIRIAAEEMGRHNIGSLLVLDRDGTLIGIISERDILSKVVAKGLNPIAVRVAQVMTPHVVGCHPGASTKRANELMASHNIRHLPIIENGEPIGMVSARDLMAHELELARQRLQQHRERLERLERHHPGITDLTFDDSGRMQL